MSDFSSIQSRDCSVTKHMHPFYLDHQCVTRCHTLKMGDFKSLISKIENLNWQWVHKWHQFPELVMHPTVGQEEAQNSPAYPSFQMADPGNIWGCSPGYDGLSALKSLRA